MLSTAELSRLDDFVNSPVHNKHKEVMRLFAYLKKHLNGKRAQLSKENVFQHLYGKIPLDSQQLNLVNSYLTKVVEEFLAWTEWSENKNKESITLLKTYNKRKAVQHFNRVFSGILKKEEKSFIRNSDYYQRQYDIQFQLFTFSELQGRKKEVNLPAVSENLDIYYCIERLRVACFQLSQQAIYKQSYEVGMLEEVVSFVSKNELHLIPAIGIYYYGYLSLANPDQEVHFEQLKRLIKKEEQRFEISDLKEIYLMAINYCIRRINSNDVRYLSEVFDLYQSGLDNKVFLENNILSRWTYNNIIIAGLKLEAFDWVEKFIYDYKTYLQTQHQESSFSFNLAKFYFEKGDYQAAMPLLMKMEYDDFFHNMVAKTTLAKIYFELKELDALENLLNSMKVYIQRQRIIGYHKENYRNILRFMKKLMYLNFGDADKINELKERIRSTKVLTEKNWFLAKLGRD